MVDLIRLILPWVTVGSVWFDDKTGKSELTFWSILVSIMLDSDDDGRTLVMMNSRRVSIVKNGYLLYVNKWKRI